MVKNWELASKLRRAQVNWLKNDWSNLAQNKNPKKLAYRTLTPSVRFFILLLALWVPPKLNPNVHFLNFPISVVFWFPYHPPEWDQILTKHFLVFVMRDSEQFERLNRAVRVVEGDHHRAVLVINRTDRCKFAAWKNTAFYWRSFKIFVII